MKTSCKQCLPEVMLSGLVTCGQCLKVGSGNGWNGDNVKIITQLEEWWRRHTSRAEQSCLHWSKWNTTYTRLSSGLCHWSSSHNCLIILIQHQLKHEALTGLNKQQPFVCVLHVCTHRHLNLNIRLNGACLWLKQGELYTFIQRWRFQGFQGRVWGRGYTLLFLQSVTRNTLALIQVGSRGNRQRSRNICTWRQRQPLGEKNQETQGGTLETAGATLTKVSTMIQWGATIHWGLD